MENPDRFGPGNDPNTLGWLDKFVDFFNNC